MRGQVELGNKLFSTGNNPVGPFHTFEQRRHLQDQCSVNKALSTPYNENDDFPSFYGMLFTIDALSDINILTFEMDIRFEEAKDDLSIEVYTMPGDFATTGDFLSYKNDPLDWTLVARTTGVPIASAQGKGLIIPSTEFDSVLVKDGDRISFYVTMRGPYLDNVANALMQTREEQVKGEDIRVLVGAGLSSYDFPEEIDPIVDPQFAGTIHYKRMANCDEITASTTVTYLFLLSEDTKRDIDEVVDQTLDEIMSSSQIFALYEREYSLIITKRAETSQVAYDGGCPEDWAGCTPYYLQTAVTFQHSEDLDPAHLLYELYRPVQAITRNVQDEFGKTDVFYMGLKSLQAGFVLNLSGVPEGEQMDAIQAAYFEQITETFLQQQIAPSDASAVDVYIQHQEFVLSTAESILSINGQIRGTRYAYMPNTNWEELLISAFHVKESYLLEMLSEGRLRPGNINLDNRYEYFLNLTDLTAEIMPVENAAPDPNLSDDSKGQNKAMTAAIAGGVAGGVIVLLLIAYMLLYRHIRRREKKTKRADSPPTTLDNSIDQLSGDDLLDQNGKLVDNSHICDITSRGKKERQDRAQASAHEGTGTSFFDAPDGSFSRKSFTVKDRVLPRPPSLTNLRKEMDQGMTSKSAKPGWLSSSDHVLATQSMNRSPQPLRRSNGDAYIDKFSLTASDHIVPAQKSNNKAACSTGSDRTKSLFDRKHLFTRSVSNDEIDPMKSLSCRRASSCDRFSLEKDIASSPTHMKGQPVSKARDNRRELSHSQSTEGRISCHPEMLTDMSMSKNTANPPAAERAVAPEPFESRNACISPRRVPLRSKSSDSITPVTPGRPNVSEKRTASCSPRKVTPRSKSSDSLTPMRRSPSDGTTANSRVTFSPPPKSNSLGGLVSQRPNSVPLSKHLDVYGRPGTAARDTRSVGGIPPPRSKSSNDAGRSLSTFMEGRSQPRRGARNGAKSVGPGAHISSSSGHTLTTNQALPNPYMLRKGSFDKKDREHGAKKF